MSQIFGVPYYFINDPAIVQDLFTKQNTKIDKVGDSEAIFLDLLGKSFLFSKGDDVWKAKRKACSHAFYKERLVNMLETFKVTVMDRFRQWEKLIDESETKSISIDMGYEFERLFSRNIITISLGEDISDDLVDIVKWDKTGVFTNKKCSIRECIQIIMD